MSLVGSLSLSNLGEDNTRCVLGTGRVTCMRLRLRRYNAGWEDDDSWCRDWLFGWNARLTRRVSFGRELLDRDGLNYSACGSVCVVKDTESAGAEVAYPAEVEVA